MLIPAVDNDSYLLYEKAHPLGWAFTYTSIDKILFLIQGEQSDKVFIVIVGKALSVFVDRTAQYYRRVDCHA